METKINSLKTIAGKSYEKARNAMSDAASKIAGQSQDSFLMYVLIVFIITAIICLIIYYTNLNKRTNKQCQRLDSLYSSINTKISSICSSSSEADTNLNPLYDYYIKTAFNCCNIGNYDYDYVDVCVLKDILKQGVRCLDFEIYSSNDNQPIVSSSTNTNYNFSQTINKNPLYFSKVMDILNNYAFSTANAPNPKDPMILHFRFMSNNEEMYNNLVKIFVTYEDNMLGSSYSYVNANNGNKMINNIGNTNIQLLAGKFIIIVDNSNTTFSNNTNLTEYVNGLSNSNFMRLFICDSTNSIINQVQDINELTDYNRRHMSIVLPNTKSNKPVNTSSLVTNALGCQMTAMCFQTTNDNYLTQYNNFFDNEGAGFVLKPPELRFIAPPEVEIVEQSQELSYAPRNISSDYYSFNI
jgi:hypothetical protein